MKKPVKKVAHFYSGNLFGGVETVLLQLHHNRRFLTGIEFSYVLCFEGLLAKKLRAAGARVTILARPVKWSRPWTVWRAIRELRHLFESEKWDLFISHDFWAYSVSLGALLLGRRLRVSWFHNSGKGYPLALLMRFLPVNWGLCCSQFIMQQISKFAPLNQIRVIYAPQTLPNLIEESRRHTQREKLGVGDGEIIILHVGRMSSYKGQKTLLRAFATISDPQIKLWFVGGGQQPHERQLESELKAMVSALGLVTRVRFFGFQESVAPFYEAADIFCHPNIEPEPFGLVFIEALAYGLPVVATYLGGAIEIFEDQEGDYGVLVPPNDEVKLGEALGELIKNQDLIKRFRVLGPKRAQSLCSPILAMNRLQNALFEIMGTGSE